MRRLLLLVALPLVVGQFLFSNGYGQTTDTVWHHDLAATFNISQVSYSHWVAGGTNALSYIASMNGRSARFDTTTPTIWSTIYKFAYGQTKLGDNPIQKTQDEINVESVVKYKWGVDINPYASISLLTQFAPGYIYNDTNVLLKTQVSGFFDPAYIKQAIGVGFVMGKGLHTRFGLALREIITNHYRSFADDPATPQVEATRIEGGLENVTSLEMPIDDNVLIRANSELFVPIKTLDRVVEHAQVTIIGRISKYFVAEFGATLIEEPDISPYAQLKQGLSLGITYTVF